ncbi:MAG: M20 family metallopeptidase [Proteobacteria bacterium]|nr:M20 family metallopeptidase [Pseudomonadota bacterium]MBU1715069.1 M20 family metallopeptidase [Pseudomonadota bacterium]
MDVITFTRELIRVPSESSDPVSTDTQAPERGVVRLLQEVCDAYGVSWWTTEALPGRHNFMVRFPYPGTPRVLIIAHMDTVSSRGMTGPFAAEVRDGKIWGRGSCDDKGPLAAALITLLELYRQNRELVYDVTFVATVDEECTMSGAVKLAEDIDDWDLCIALEPTTLKIIRAHKGVYRFLLRTKGVAAHSSAPAKGENAVEAMLPILADIGKFGREISARHNQDLGHASLAITKINGGSSLNTIPDRCEAAVDIRLLPEMTPDEMARQVRACVAGRAEVVEVYRGNGIDTKVDHPLIRKLRHHINLAGGDPQPITAAFATDCSKLAHKGPCIVWGPGDIRQAHQVDEHIELSQLEAATHILARFLTRG